MKTKILLLIGLVFISPILLIANPIRVGIAGMTHDHVGQALHAAQKNADVQIVGFAEKNKDLAMRLLKEYHLPESLWFPDLETLISQTKPEAVCAFNSIYEHLEVVQTCAPKGIHVMVEKPLAVNMDHLAQMKALVKKHPIALLTNFETTWYPSHAKMWDMLKVEKSLGDLRKVVIMDGHNGPVEIGCSKEFLAWLTDPKMNGGGALIDFGCYGANIMTWLMEGQKPISVTAVSQHLKPHIYPKVDDETTIILNYPSCQAIIQGSWNWPFDRKDTELYASKGILVANKTKQMKYVSEGRFGKESLLQLSPLAPERANVFAYLAAVVQGKIDPQKDLSSLAINEIVVEILSAATESAKTHKTIFLK
ncbi:Gfo/Idh/MocA family protein [Aquirufa ecclesiirivi]